MDFEWDPEKAARNLARHGITFPDAATVFDDPLALSIADPDHSQHEERHLTLGRSIAGRLLVVSHTDRAGRTRMISSRPASRKERKSYEEA
jgi:uncharacterized protein